MSEEAREEERPTPEELLASIKQEEQASKKGRLKIFLGMAAGVGKTYAMLKEAQVLKNEGVDLVVGIVDTHGRKDTAELLEGLKVIPEKTINYKGKEFKELDVETIIQLKPQIALVDELAHNNIPGSLHAKRWQDVLELLDNGINVYSTLNIQHIESLNDIIKGISGIAIGETVPDSVVEKATSIQIVDLTPEELLQRLKEGKVYIGDQSRIAIENFFQKDRLTALREIVLRYGAEKVDRDLREMVPESERVIDWKPRERFLVGVSHTPLAQKLIRTTRRLAANMNAPWFAVHVNDGRTLSERDDEQLAKNLQLAKDLGAEVVTINEISHAEGIKKVARQYGVTQIVVGRPPKRTLMGIFAKPPLMDKLAAELSDIDIHVVRQPRYPTAYKKPLIPFYIAQQYKQYIAVLAIIALIWGFNWFALPFIGDKLVGFVFLLSILFLSLFFKKGPIILASFLTAIIWAIFFIPPAGEISALENEDIVILAFFLLTGTTTAILVDREREHRELLIKNEATTNALYQIVRQIVSSPSTPEIYKSVKEALQKFFNGSFEIAIKQVDNGLKPDPMSPLLQDEKEKNAAIWSFENEREAGWSTDTLPASQNLYIPLRSPREVVGVLIYRPQDRKTLTAEEKSFLYTVSQQLAAHIARTFSEERIRKSTQMELIEKVQHNVLDRLSSEFEFPIVTTLKSIKALKNKLEYMRQADDIKLIRAIESSFESFVKILANISAMSKLSEGFVSLRKKVHNIDELVEDVCKSVKASRDGHKIKIHIEKDLPQVSFDFYLLEILLYNLLDNAITYSPEDSEVDIDVRKSDKHLIISVSDEGPGIPESEQGKIFEKFYRTKDKTHAGSGLGLSIAKTIAELHDGYIRVENLPVKGAKFSLYLPI